MYNVLVLRILMLECSRVENCDIGNLLSNSTGKKEYVERGKCDKISSMDESRGKV